jgi:hypothetical protein
MSLPAESDCRLPPEGWPSIGRSDGDDDLSATVSSSDLGDRRGHLAKRVPGPDHRPDLVRLDQFLERGEVRAFARDRKFVIFCPMIGDIAFARTTRPIPSHRPVPSPPARTSVPFGVMARRR